MMMISHLLAAFNGFATGWCGIGALWIHSGRRRAILLVLALANAGFAVFEATR